MKNKNKKLAMVLTLIAAGSVFYGTTQAEARGLELDGIQIVFGRHHDHYDPPPPPPPPHHHRHWHRPPPPPPPPPHHHHGHRPPPPPHFDHRGPEHFDRRPDDRGPRPQPPRR